MARVLVVDDDPDILRIVEKVLRLQNHHVFTAHDAMKALELLNSSVFDLLITDANMPKFSGFELTRMVKNNKRFHRMAICMLTGLREKRDIERAIRAGIDDYIVKPIDPQLLLQKVEEIFSKKPPLAKAELVIPEKTAYAAAQISTASRVSMLSELGLVLRSPVEIPEGLSVIVHTELFKKMGLQNPPPLKVISCRKLVEFDFEVTVAFQGMSESFQLGVRHWILTEAAKKGKAA
jgi:DNA-binding response OmpR family regulator